ncbi:hypothetical protein FJY63_13275, partial [Candidatus Sumerlaeota bacterium]|nr:hypothetical protein [Candidatus Sumerlaeota bacterium]
RDVGFRTALNTKGIGLEERPDLLRLSDVLVLSLDTLDPASLARFLGRPQEVAERVLEALRFALSTRRATGTALVLSAVATPDNVEGVSAVLRFATENSLGFHLSPEIVGTRVNPALRGNESYRKLVNEVLRAKRSRKGVLGVADYLKGIRDFSPFRCHPLLMPVIRPDGRMYYPCLESKRAEISPIETGSYWSALRLARRQCGEVPECHDCCHIFCHMAISLLQRHPLAALGERKHWRN